MTVQIINADVLVGLATLADESVDCIVTDPPYGETSLAWDVVPERWMAECRRVLRRSGSIRTTKLSNIGKLQRSDEGGTMGKGSDVRLDGEAMKQAKRERGIRNLAAADPKGWTQHADHHWSRTLAGQRLDYWPSRNKFQYEGRVMTGDVRGFIARRELPPEQRPQPEYFVDDDEQ